MRLHWEECCPLHKHLAQCLSRSAIHLVSLSCELPVVSVSPPPPVFISSSPLSSSFPPPSFIEETEFKSVWFPNTEKDMSLYILMTQRESSEGDIISAPSVLCSTNCQSFTVSTNNHYHYPVFCGPLVAAGHCWWSGLYWGSAAAVHWSSTPHCPSVLRLLWLPCPLLLPFWRLVCQCSEDVLFSHWLSGSSE